MVPKPIILRTPVPRRTARIRRRRTLSTLFSLMMICLCWAGVASWTAVQKHAHLSDAQAASQASRVQAQLLQHEVETLSAEREQLAATVAALQTEMTQIITVAQAREQMLAVSKLGEAGLARLSLLAPSGLTAADIDRVVAGSPLAGLGAVFVAAERQYQVNAGALLAMAVLESDWGRSRLAQERHNLFGFMAYDSNIDAARYFSSSEECVLFVASYLQREYLMPEGRWWNSGTSLGHIGVLWAPNVPYSDRVSQTWLSLIEKGLYGA